MSFSQCYALDHGEHLGQSQTAYNFAPDPHQISTEVSSSSADPDRSCLLFGMHKYLASMRRVRVLLYYELINKKKPRICLIMPLFSMNVEQNFV